MIPTPTVLILGAGASWHYPTGEKLVRKVIEKAEDAWRYFQHPVSTENDNQP
jgi:hypothetical protein